MRIVLDTNILISSLIQSRGPSAMLVNAWRDGRIRLISSQAQLDELRDVLGSPRIQKLVNPSEAVNLLGGFPDQAEMVEPTSGVDLSPDPDDNAIIATAIAGQAELIVTGDKGHMVVLGEAQGIPIVTPRQAVERLGEKGAKDG